MRGYGWMRGGLAIVVVAALLVAAGCVIRPRGAVRISGSPPPVVTAAPVAAGGRVYFLAGEDSGDLHAANLIASLKEAAPEVDVRGMGGANRVPERLGRIVLDQLPGSVAQASPPPPPARDAPFRR